MVVMMAVVVRIMVRMMMVVPGGCRFSVGARARSYGKQGEAVRNCGRRLETMRNRLGTVRK
eukprot:1491639-Alexandrium_andersonii.AAC.1